MDSQSQQNSQDQSPQEIPVSTSKKAIKTKAKTKPIKKSTKQKAKQTKRTKDLIKKQIQEQQFLQALKKISYNFNQEPIKNQRIIFTTQSRKEKILKQFNGKVINQKKKIRRQSSNRYQKIMSAYDSFRSPIDLLRKNKK